MNYQLEQQLARYEARALKALADNNPQEAIRQVFKALRAEADEASRASDPRNFSDLGGR